MVVRSERAHLRRVAFAVFHLFAKTVYKVLFSVKIIDEKLIPRNEALIFLSNHVSNMDPVIVGLAVPEELHYMAKKELFGNILFRWLIVAFRAFPIRRGAIDRKAQRRALEILDKGESLLTFPEGTRGNGIDIQPAKAGVGMLVYKAKKRVVPVLITGAEKVMPRGSRFFRLRHLEVKFGRPLQLEDYFKMPRERGTYELIAEEITRGLKALQVRQKDIG